MWRNVLVLVVLIEVYLESGMANDQAGYYQNEMEVLCNLYRALNRVLKKYGENEPLRNGLVSAIYGSDEGNTLFESDGNIKKLAWRCRDGRTNARALLCSYKSGKGCFAENLLGAFLCICTPGNNDANQVCGVSHLGRDNTWFGWQDARRKEALFKEVWGKFKEKCTDQAGNSLTGAGDLETLKSALKNTTGKLRDGANGFFYFGGTGDGGCSGSSGSDVCVAYKREGTGVSVVWADRISQALVKLEEAESSAKAATIASAQQAVGSTQDLGAVVENEKSSEATTQTAPAPRKESKAVKEEEEPGAQVTQIPRNHKNASKKIEKRNSPLSTLTNIPHLASDPNEDGSLLTVPRWLLLVVLLN
ncbi:Variant surface glycoprotein [Trypanosoma congolense IL3000]|uniref:Variant surface glycoprotein n=1 Tax=Trypanosoma congolense (strain IL3000) TaxID=1068625 RepID=F9W3B9_TRYCI|nr:Variant surface glycoprotein [Trypanosoma congolense IL3000]